ncbi:MAG TPA: response regulator [Bryobacteraceae bacterium]|nr:response regulator [Bryobacteraceae bacterium]
MKSFRVLLVEDSASDVRLFREALKETSGIIQLAVVQDGFQATEYFRQAEVGLKARPDLVLLDWNLPLKDGREVLRDIKASATLKQIPVLIMTSSKAADDIRSAYSLNANCYLAKPSSLPEYIDVARSIEDFWFKTATLPENFPRSYREHHARLAS